VTSASFYGMYLQSGASNANIFNNTISVQVTTNNGTFYGIYDAMSYDATTTVNIHDNTINGCTFSSTAASFSGTCYYYNIGHSSVNFSFYKQQMHE